MRRREFITFLGSAAITSPLTALAADYKLEFRMSVVANEDTAWGRAANRFADAVRFRTQGRINIKNYFEGRLFTGEQTTEFDLMQRGTADFAIARQSTGRRR
jgi:TRAP-type C4-dicarboxylate transport system substrate-binding protein